MILSKKRIRRCANNLVSYVNVSCFCVFLLTLPCHAHGQTIIGEVTNVYDGNTLDVRADNEQTYRVVLMGIDCPELRQSYGNEAMEFVSEKLSGKKVVLSIHGKDRFKNYIGIVLFNDSADIRQMLLREGLAWTTERNPMPELELVREEAARRKTGLWKEEFPMAPWVFRRRNSMSDPKSR